MYHENHETKRESVDGAYPIVRGGKAVIRALGFVFILKYERASSKTAKTNTSSNGLGTPRQFAVGIVGSSPLVLRMKVPILPYVHQTRPWGNWQTHQT